MTDPSSLRHLGPRTLAGYRVLRSLARDEHAEVLLGHRRVAVPAGERAAEGVADAELQTELPNAMQTVAIKVSAASDSGWRTALLECAAIECARGDHVVDLLDLDSDHESIRLIFERLPRGDLAELLRVRPSLDAGEAVTLLAPIAATLLRMHAAGVAHGNLSARTILFRDDGSPTLVGFSRAELFEPGAPEVVLEQVDAVRRDRSAAESLTVAVLGRVEGARARDARELLADVEECDDEFILPLLASRLFEVAAAVPIRFEAGEPEADATPSSWRAIPVGEAVAERDAGSVAASPSGWRSAIGRLVPEPVLGRMLDAVGHSPAAPVLATAAAAVGRRWNSWGPGRRRGVLAVAAAAATVGIVTVLAPVGAVATGGPGSSVSAAGSPSDRPGSSASRTAEDPGDGIDPALVADDPVAAAGALVTARDRCLTSVSARCLNGVDEPGSSALDADQAAMRMALRGGELPDPLQGATAAGSAELIERLGDSALVRLGGAPSATSLLLVKGDAGWRIRDVIFARVAESSSPSPSATAG